ncbi:MAG: glycosyltransferase [Acidobacteria bacterium]|nr:glycosyltransferase [Acidobacteriota bacterium]
MLKKIAKAIFLLVSPLLLAGIGWALILNDLLCHLQLLLRRERSALSPSDSSPQAEPYERPRNASIVIPNWNGKDLLEKFLPTVLAACQSSDEVIVVDNASSDGSAEFVRQRFPQVRLLPMPRNLGFGGGANAGVQAARHRIVVLLNNDMRATPDFLAPLLNGFTDNDVFAVSAQIFFSDPSRRREETGLTTGRFEKGFVRVGHAIDDQIDRIYPIFYAGGGSTAYDREKFLALGGFDPLFEPFYVEDTDLSYGAWRKGWKVLYQPQSRLYHEHRATIGKHYTPEAIRVYLQKNNVLMVWKNIHHWRWLLQHLVRLYGHLLLSSLGQKTESRTTLGAFSMALRMLPQAIRSRHLALLRAAVDDRAVFERTRPAAFRDVFPPKTEQPLLPGQAPPGTVSDFPSPVSAGRRPLNILFVSAYSISPPLHGGGVVMFDTLRELAKKHNLFVLTFVDRPEEAVSNRCMEEWLRKVETVLRRPPPIRQLSPRSSAQQVFYDPAFSALLEKLVFLHDIDLIQFEYTQLAQYRLPLRRTPQCLYEHDVYFHSLQRQMFLGGHDLFAKAEEFWEWLRALRFEINAVSKFDAVFTVHEKERLLLESFLNGQRPRVIAGLRTGIDVSRHAFPGGPRQPDSLLFVGNFQHSPNVQGLQFFCQEVFPRIRAQRPEVTLAVVGAHAPPELQQILRGEGIHFLGKVDDIREPLGHHAVFVCPILSGAGLRVKLLEAFASGIPVISTSLGAEGIAAIPGTHLLIADSPADFAAACLRLLEQPKKAAALAANARRIVETTYDWSVLGRQLEQIYYQLVTDQTRLPPR